MNKSNLKYKSLPKLKVHQDGWEGGALKKYPVGIFSERASLPRGQTKLEDPSAGTYEYKYDNLGRMLWEKTPKGITKHWYDQYGKPTKEETIGDETYLKQEFVYDAVSKLPIEIKGWNNPDNQNFTYKTHYDEFFRITGKTEVNPAFTYTTTTVFDDSQEAGGRVKETRSKVTLSTDEISEVITQPVYDNNGILNELREGNTQKSLWKIDATNARGQVEQLTYGNGFRINTTYDAYGLPQQLKDSHSSKGVALEMEYQFNAARGLLNSRTNKLFNLQEAFQFDDLNRLVEESQNGLIDKFSYDNRGRITGSTDLGKYSYFPDNYHLKQIEYNAEGTAHKELFGLPQVTYNSYKKATLIDGKLADYRFGYNPLKTRAAQIVTDSLGNTIVTKFYSADHAIEVEIRGNETRILTYVDGGPYEASVIHENKNGQEQFLYLHKDYLGSILAISDEAANILEQRSFDAWGNLDKLKVGNLLLQTQAEIVN